ncbi:MAG TPA: response regulator [Rhodothermales bacterium]|nr:response regulator [Rhodothermales bacterium]
MSKSAFLTSITILLVEDDPEDVYILKKVLERSRLRKTLYVVETGEDALRFLRRESPFEAAPRPKIILLDLRLPDISGLEVLRQVKDDPLLRPIPVIVLTNSSNQKDLVEAYDERARAFITKPADRSDFEKVIETIEAFWLTIAKLPTD